MQAPGSPFATGKGTWRMAVGNLNADGKADVVTSNLEAITSACSWVDSEASTAQRFP